MLDRFTNAFPLWVLLAALASLYRPELFAWFKGSMIPAGLGVIMLGMGLTMKIEDFRRVAKIPFQVFIGVLLQYTIMPFMGWLAATIFKLDAPLAAGVILVACCPGGTASNVVSYLAKADVPLSVTMTTISTLIAVIMTPLWTLFLVGNRVDVNGMGLLVSTFQVVILPVVAGLLMNKLLPKLTQKILPAAPLTAVIFIALIVGSVVGAGREQILKSGVSLILACFTLHTGGFLIGYIVSRVVLKKEIPARTISIEVGMQNSGLGIVLARANFSNPLVAIPCAISSVFHSVIASLLAAAWRPTAEKFWASDEAANVK